MIIGVPVIAVIFAGINSITNSKLKKKNMPIEEERYFEVGEVTHEGECTHDEYIEPPKQKPSKAIVRYYGYSVMERPQKNFSWVTLEFH